MLGETSPHVARETLVAAGSHGPAGEANRAVRVVMEDTQATVRAQDGPLIGRREGGEKASWRRWHFNLTAWTGARLPW